MRIKTYTHLDILIKKFGSQEFGKLCQKFLAIAFLNAGYNHVIERTIQGVDIDVANKKGEKYSIEVKTTITEYITFKEKDLIGLKSREKDGYQSILAILRLTRFSNWIFVKANQLNSGTSYVDIFRPHRLKRLENFINPLFENIVQMHFEGTFNNGQEYLSNILKNYIQSNHI